MSNLEQRVILLTGASQGIGAESARILRDRGAALVAHYRAEKERADLVELFGEQGTSSMYYVAGDFLEDAQVDALWDRAVAWRGNVDVLVLNAAMMSPRGGVDDDEESWRQSWQQHYQVNVQAQARLMRAAVRHFKARGGGIIILI